MNARVETVAAPEWENITPAKATQFLNRNNNNRKLRSGMTEKYAADMAAGRWTLCPEPISFYENGDLADGQHRLWAIIESGTTQRFLVLRNLPIPAGLNINTGGIRTLMDAAEISGHADGLSKQLIGVARAIEEGAKAGGKRPMSYAERLEVIERQRDAATWAISHGPRGRGAKFVRNAITLAAIGRAWYVEQDKDRLARFCAVLDSGTSIAEDELAAVAIRNYLMAKGPVVSSEPLWKDTFYKVQNAIRYFMRRRALTVVKGVQEEAYPLPHDKHPPAVAAVKKMTAKAKGKAKK